MVLNKLSDLDNILEKVADKINDKGWGLYLVGELDVSNIGGEATLPVNLYPADECIRRGPVKQLKVGKIYFLYPTLSESERTNVEKVRKTAFILSNNLGTTPTIMYDDEPLPLRLICFCNELVVDLVPTAKRSYGGRSVTESVKEYPVEEYRIPYNVFLEDLSLLMPTLPVS
ncbi:hypothetical protein AUJ69_03665 [Candidatus Woesearchaeota archaeon CG1_02_47_18]|nr:MAG: hypothetical protein AUJ69_03665 [Candidatus Woesearchaeota archaeon CG1_02_47_18]HII29968.1 hypothetical protein [Candidatus Woesearchaeota archaeon]